MVGIGIVGAGNWGKNLVRTFSSLPGAQLRGICDRNTQTLASMAVLYPGVRLYEEPEELFAAADVEAVVVAVDAPRHFAVGRRALETGHHLLGEKPLTLKSSESEELIRLAAERQRKLMVGHLLEYHPAVTYMKGLITAGQIGAPLYLYSQRLNLGIVRTAENAWWSLAPHDVSVACHLFDAEPVTVSATGQAYLQPGIADVVFASLKFADGRLANIHVSWLDPHKIRKVTLVGAQKMVVFDDMDASEKIRIYDKGAEVRTSVSYEEAITLRTGDILIPKVPAAAPLKLECRHFVDCILQDRTPLSDGHDGRRVVRILEAGDRSLAQGGAPVAI